MAIKRFSLTGLKDTQQAKKLILLKTTGIQDKMSIIPNLASIWIALVERFS